jgi:hypothetical protein
MEISEKYCAPKSWYGLFMPLLLLLVSWLTVPCRAVVLDGRADAGEWWNCPKTELVRAGDASLCSITRATVCCEINMDEGNATFGFWIFVEECQRNAPIGATFLANGQPFAAWQQGVGGSGDLENISILGAAWIPEVDAFNDYYSFEVSVTDKNMEHTEFFRRMQTLQVRLFDPKGVPSAVFQCPVAFVQPTAEPTTATKETTTAAPTIVKETTTRAPTTTKETTVKTTANKTTADKTAALKTTAKTTAAKAAAVIALPASTQAAANFVTEYHTAAPPPERVTSVVQYSAPVKQAADAGAALADTTTQALPAAPALAPAPTLAAFTAQPAAARTPLLFGAAGLLLALSLLLGFFWARAQHGGAAA